MEFDLNDEKDRRIAESSPRALDYPKDAGQAPDREGVYLLINSDNEVICVGMASGSSLKDEIKAQGDTGDEKGAKTCRWFVTRSSKAAEELGADLIRKYCL